MRAAHAADAPRPLYVVWEITLSCDLACSHCGSRAGKARTGELTTDEALDVIRQLAEMGACEVTLIGGEAYLREDWLVIAAAIVERGMRCTMTTGGRGITQKRAQALAAAGVSAVSVSIDGLSEAHDRQRNLVGSFDAAVRALRHLREAKVPHTGNTQLNRLSVPDLDSVLDLLVAEGAQGWQVQLTVPMGRAADRPEWLLQPYELLELYPRLAALAKRGLTQGVRLWPANNIGYFGPFESILRNRGGEGPRAWQGCPAGKFALGIEADGTIKGCPSLPTAAWGGGNVREQSLSRIWNETRELRYTRDRDRTDLWGFCATCYYADECRGGCTWTAHSIFGKPGNNPYCHHRVLELAERGVRERIELRAPAPGRPFDHASFELVEEPWDGATEARRRLPLAP
ncbi:MAG: radical SAM protein [Myxococcales bacterium]|nr:radical SAM protein [Myxococcales bacterium]MCB9581632.1 radical SAM protein [Polyangiaceae bacterium]